MAALFFVSCDQKDPAQHPVDGQNLSGFGDDAAHAPGGSEKAMQEESEREFPSDATICRVAEKLEDQFLNLGGELADQPFTRGRELISRGGGEIPGGTVIYPVRFEDFAVTFYLSQDSFGGWQFSVGEKNNSAGRIGLVQFKDRIVDLRFSSELVIALGQPRKPTKPETEVAKQKSLRKEKEAQERAISEEQEKTQRSLDSPSSSSMGESGGATRPTPTPKAPEPESKSSPASDKSVRLAEAKAELAGLESKIGAERQRYQKAIDTINHLTNFKKTPVKEGSAAYHQCMEASRVIQEIEHKAPSMTAEKTRLVTLIAELEKE